MIFAMMNIYTTLVHPNNNKLYQLFRKIVGFTNEK